MSLLQEKKNYSLQDHINNFINPNQLSQEQIDEIISNENYYPLAFTQLFSKKENFPIKHITNEIEIFNDNIYNNLCTCHTRLGKIYTNKMLNNPSSDLIILGGRQDILRRVCQNYSVEIERKIVELRENVEDIFWFFKDKNEHSDEIYNMIFFTNDYLKFLNKFEPFLTISNAYKIVVSPILSACSPLIYIIVPFVIMRLMKVKIPFSFFAKMMWQQSGMISLPFIKNPVLATVVKYFSKFLSVFLYCQNVYYSYTTSKNTLNIVNLFQNKLENVKELLKLNTMINENKIYSELIGEQNYPNNFTRIEECSIYNGRKFFLTNKGRILKDFYEFVENKMHFLRILNNIGFIDSYFGFARLLREGSYYNIPKFLVKTYPQLELKGIWHPAIPREKNVKNEISFTEKSRNFLLTGPNAAGKSTFIKSVFLNIYLAQTIGICNSEKMEFTPFCYLLTGIRNKDSQGSESLFEAEVHKIRDYLENIKIKGEKGFTFSILDEIFTSTNYQEGFAASYGLCETIGKMKNSLHIVATHFTELHKIEGKKEYGFKNIKFSVNLEKDKIEFPYKLEKGFSNQFIALRLMKDKDCDNEFLNCCIKKLERGNKVKKIKRDRLDLKTKFCK